MSNPQADAAGHDMGGGLETSDIDAIRLAHWMRAHVEGFAGPVTVGKFPGGQSNPTYRIDAASGSYVLRRKPFGALLPSAHAVDREYRLISALHPTGFPVARPFALCEDADVIGSMFYIMEMVHGRTFWDGPLPALDPVDRTLVYHEMVRTLARLHSVDHDAVGLGDYGPPGNYFVRQVGRWTKQYRAAQTDDIPQVERLIAWLAETVPEQTRTSIIHGDYRIDNLIYAVDAPRVVAVLDWELSTIGDPLADFAYLAMNWGMPVADRGAGLLGADFAATGIPDLDEATRLYCDATGRDGIPQLDWYFSYNLFRLLGIVQGIKKRFLDGNAASAKAEDTIKRIPHLATQAWEFARRAGAPA